MPKNTDCLECGHFHGLNTCNAFPNGIPQRILSGLDEHTTPLKGQGNDFVFTPFEKMDAVISKHEKNDAKQV